MLPQLRLSLKGPRKDILAALNKSADFNKMEIDAEEPRYIYTTKVLISEHSVLTIRLQLPKWASPLQNLYNLLMIGSIKLWNRKTTLKQSYVNLRML